MTQIRPRNGVVAGVLAGLIWFALAGGGAVRLDVQSDLPDSFELFEYQSPNFDPVVEVRRNFKPFSSIRFPVTSDLVHFRIDTGEHPGVVRIRRLCFEQSWLFHRCFDGAQLLPHVRRSNGVSLTGDGRDLVVVSKSSDPYINFLPSLAGYPYTRIYSSILVAICVFLLFTFPGALLWFACAAVLAWSVSNWAELFRLTRQIYTAVPVMDYWRIVANIPRYARFDLSVLWQQHNEHRIIFPELAMAADALLFHGRALLPIAVDFLFQWLTLAVYVRTIWRTPLLDPKLRWFTILFACGLAGWPGLALFFGHPFLVQWMFLQVAVVLALAALPVSVGFAVAGGVVATYSSANGMLVWPVLILAALALRLDRRRVLALFLAGVLFTGLYFVGFHPGPQGYLDLPLHHPVWALQFVAAYLSLPFGFVSAQTGSLTGLAGLLVLAALVFVNHSSVNRRSSSRTVLFLGSALFIVGSAALAASGRMPPDHAAQSIDLDLRFVSLPLWFWLSILFAAIHTKWDWRIAGTCGAVVAVLFALTSSWIDTQLPAFQSFQLASLALETGVPDASLIGETLYYEPELVEQQTEKLRSRRLSVFATGRFEWLGKRASAIFRGANPGTAVGAVTSSKIVDGGMRITGWAAGDWSDIVFVNESGVIVGFGGRFGGGWSGYANLEFGGKSLRVYRIEGGQMAAISDPIALPEALSIPFSRMGQFLTGVKWLVEGGGAESAVSPELGGQPYGVVYGTWNSKHKAPGRIITEPFDAPPGNCVVIPAGHAAPVTGETIQLVDGERQTPIATLPIGDNDQTWRLWRVTIPEGVRTLRIVADDRGLGGTQWLGLGQPARCTSSYR